MTCLYRRFAAHLLMCAAAMLGCCAAAQAQPSLSRLTIAVSRGPVSLPIYAAEAQGFFKQEGLEARLVECSSGRACLDLLAGGQAELATSAELPVTLRAFTAQDMAIVATMSTSSHQIKLIGRRSKGIEGVESVRGSVIGTVSGTSAQYFLDSWLTFHGMDRGLVLTLPLQPDKVVEALRQGEVDAIAIWEPMASQAAQALKGDAVVFPSPRVYTQHFNLVAPKHLLPAREAELVKLLKALAKAQRWIQSSGDGASQLLQQRLGVDASMAQAYLKEHDYRLRLDQSLISTMEGQVRWAVREGLAADAKRPKNLLQSIYPGALRQVAESAVTLPH